MFKKIEIKKISFLILLIFQICYSTNAYSQYEYGLSLKIVNIDYVNRKFCVDLRLQNLSSAPYGLAGQNIRLFYDTDKMKYIENSAKSVLPKPAYTDLVIVSFVENLDASGIGDLSFESDLGFFNFYIDLNDVANGGSIVQPDIFLTIANICFEFNEKEIDLACTDLVLAEEGITGVYANAFNIVSLWLGENKTTTGEQLSLKSINSINPDDCIDFVENTLDACNDGMDNDGDGDIDCDDIDCEKPEISSVVINNPTQSSCPLLNNGSIQVTASKVGSYSINGGTTSQMNGDFTNLMAGVYKITLTNSISGCTVDSTITLVAPLCREVCNDGIDNDGDGDIDCNDIDCEKPEISSVVINNPTQSSCPLLNNGSIQVTASKVGSYSINGGTTSQMNGGFINLSAGVYKITLTNIISGCTLDTTITLVAPQCGEICNDGIDNDGDGDIDCDDIDCEKPKISSVVINNPTQSSCPLLDNGSILVTASKVGSYSINSGTTSQMNGDFINLKPGVYKITLTNIISGCTVDTTLTLVAPQCGEICNDGIDNDGDGDIDCDDIDCEKPEITSVVINNPTQSSCPLLDNGSIQVTASKVGSYSINGGTTSQMNGEFNNLAAGAYKIILTNSISGCTVDTTLTLVALQCGEIAFKLAVPNIFSPHIVDSSNDEFFFSYNPQIISEIELWEIYDRWGNVAYKQIKPDLQSMKVKWDGRSHSGSLFLPGVYIIVIYYRQHDGERNSYVGTITII